jgi:hypothetical protein
MRILREVLLSAGDVTASLNSQPLLLAHAIGYAIQYVITGSPVGSIKLQGSNDPVPDAIYTAPVPANWTDISGTTTAISAAGDGVFNANGVYYNWVRLVYTKTSGTGALTVVGNAKGF